MNKQTTPINIRRNALFFCAALLTLAYQFLHPGFYNLFIGEAVYTPKYIVQFVESFRQGILYPRWMPESFWGYGSPVFVFYSPLMYLFSALLVFIGLGVAFSITILKLLCLYIGAIYVFLLMKDRHGGRAATIAALLYTLLPTRVVDLYCINTPAGRFAEVWIPAVLYYAGKLSEEPFSRANLAKTSLSYSGLILSHIASAYILTPFIVAYSLFAGEKRCNLSTMWRISLGLFFGISISGLLFIPVLFERGGVQLEFMGSQTPYAQEFIFNFLAGKVDIEAAPLWRILRDCLVMETAILVFLLILAKRGKGGRLEREAKLFLIFVAACLFMMSSLSVFLWEFVPGMASISLPFRFEAVYLVFISALLGLLLDRIIKSISQPYFPLFIVVVVVLAMVSFDSLIIHRTSTPVPDNGGWRSFEHEMREYLPVAVDQKTLFTLRKDDPLLSAGGDVTCRVIKWGSIDRDFTVNSPRGARLRVKTFYFPGWRAWVDGKEVPLTAQEKTGAILMDVPPGRHEVALKFTDTPPRTAGKVISMLTLAGLLIMYFLSDAKESTKESGALKTLI